LTSAIILVWSSSQILINRLKFKIQGTNFEFWSELKIKIEIQGVLFLRNLKMCPRCHDNLKLCSDGETQFVVFAITGQK